MLALLLMRFAVCQRLAHRCWLQVVAAQPAWAASAPVLIGTCPEAVPMIAPPESKSPEVA